MNDLTNSASDLGQLAERINAEHTRFGESIKAGLLHAKTAGELLLQAKALLRHGEWRPWLSTHCKVSDRSASAYMRVANRWEELSKSATVADLTFRDAMRLLTHAREDRDEDQIVPTNDGKAGYAPLQHLGFEARRELTTKWFDILMSRSLLLEAEGWAPERIAEYFGQPVEDIQAIFHPEPPPRFDFPSNGSNMGEPAHRERFQQAYRAGVQGHISSMLWVSYQSASGTAERDGRPQCIQDELTALSRFHDRQYHRLSSLAYDLRSNLDEDDHAGLIACAISDARAAFRLECRTRDLPLMWTGFRDLIRAQRCGDEASAARACAVLDGLPEG